ncbi:MAG: NAD-binding protein [Campylobacterota bacterium]|nr:NAD-binding protein [Campylobacterota bacterium]
MMRKNTIIMFGYNQIAAQIVTVLKSKNYIIKIIETNEKFYENAKADGHDVQNLSLMEDENLLTIGIDQDNIKAFFCFSDDPNINLFVTLSVRNLAKELRIISLTFSKEENKKMLLAGANKTINPYEIGGLRIFRLLHKPLILEVLDNILFSTSDISVAEITIEKGSVLDGVYLKDLNLNDRYDIIIIGLQDKELGDDFIFYSSGINHKVDAADTLVAMGYSQNLRMFQQYVEPKKGI